jgi:hypothetical protein
MYIERIRCALVMELYVYMGANMHGWANGLQRVMWSFVIAFDVVAGGTEREILYIPRDGKKTLNTPGRTIGITNSTN